ncbi:MAG: hypothetical protein L6R28_06005 [Planctomycetes bacterium]|nr:hypothetical protein [Planctomycetota bacterium]
MHAVLAGTVVLVCHALAVAEDAAKTPQPPVQPQPKPQPLPTIEDISGQAASGQSALVPAVPPAPQPGAANMKGIQVPANAKIMVVPVNDEDSTRYGMIDQWQASFVKKRLGEAKADGFDLVVLDIDTNGGFVDSCDQINQAIADSGLPVVAFVRDKAFSGGAIISLGCRAVVMRTGSFVGGAQAVDLLGDMDADQRAKAVSWMVKMAQALSEKNGYSPGLARGMVDRDCVIVETDDPSHRFMTQQELDDWKAQPARRGPAPNLIRSIKPEGEVLSMTANEAFAFGFASLVVNDRDDMYTSLGVTSPQVTVASVTGTERVARFLGHPVLMVVLVIVALIGLVWELKAPGVGVGLGIFLLSIGLLLWIAFIVDRAGAAELILFALGMILLGVELFVLPGFGVAGIAGIGCVLLSIVLAFIPEGALGGAFSSDENANPFDAQVLSDSLMYASLALFAVIGAIVTVVLTGFKLPGLSRLALGRQIGDLAAAGAGGPVVEVSSGATGTAIQPVIPIERAPPPPPRALAELVGQEAVVENALMPMGKVRLAGETYAAQAESGSIDAGVRVKIIGVRPTGLVVREI